MALNMFRSCVHAKGQLQRLVSYSIQITQDAYPVLAYSNILFTLVALLVTDILHYKSIIIIGAVASVGTKVSLYFGTTLLHIKIFQLLYAVYKASNVPFRTYIYTKVKKNNYQCVTAMITITPKLGTLASALLAQFLLSTSVLGPEGLVLISLAATSLSLMAALTLPPVEGTAHTNVKTTLDQQGTKVSIYQRYKKSVDLLWEEIKFAISNINVVKWCIWWIVINGAFQMVSEYYIQALWNDVSGVDQSTFNAGVEAVYACCTTFACFILGKMKIDWLKYGEAAISIGTLMKAVTVLACAKTSSILVSYSLYVLYGTLYDVMSVIANSQIALQVKNDSFGLIFGINVFLGIIFQAILTYFLTSKNALALPIRQQFLAVGCCFGALGLIFLMKAFHTIMSSQMSSESAQKPTDSVNMDIVKTISIDVTASDELKSKPIPKSQDMEDTFSDSLKLENNSDCQEKF